MKNIAAAAHKLRNTLDPLIPMPLGPLSSAHLCNFRDVHYSSELWAYKSRRFSAEHQGRSPWLCGIFAGVDGKPNSVASALQRRQSFIWSLDRSRDLAVYPKASDGPSLIPFGIAFLFDLAPCGVCPAADVTISAVRSYRTFSPLPRLKRGGMFSVALSVGSPLPRVTRHTALWSSDFPRFRKWNRDCLLDSGSVHFSTAKGIGTGKWPQALYLSRDGAVVQAPLRGPLLGF